MKPFSFLLTAALFSAAVYYGIPWARPYIETVARAVAEMRRETHPAPSTASSSPGPAVRLGAPRRTITVPPPGRAPTRLPGAAEERSPTAVADAHAYWGVIATRTRVFSKNGEYLRHLSPGLLIEHTETVGTSNGEAALCRVMSEGRWVEDVLVPLEALVRFEGSVDAAPAQAPELLQRYYGLRGQLAEREETLRQETLAANPHAQEYRRALDAYRDFEARVKELTAQRDAAVGEARMRLADQLARMRGDGARLAEAVNRAAAPYRQSSAAHGAAPDPDADAESLRIRREIARLEPEVKALTAIQTLSSVTQSR